MKHSPKPLQYTLFQSRTLKQLLSSCQPIQSRDKAFDISKCSSRDINYLGYKAFHQTTSIFQSFHYVDTQYDLSTQTPRFLTKFAKIS